MQVVAFNAKRARLKQLSSNSSFLNRMLVLITCIFPLTIEAWTIPKPRSSFQQRGALGNPAVDNVPPTIENHGFIFKTEPTIRSESFDVMDITRNLSQLSPGYFFLDPSPPGDGWGPQIYDIYGHLVWHGPAHKRSQDFHVCDYLGEIGTHLCYNLRDPKRDILSQNVVIDDQYRRIGSFDTKLNGFDANGHDFNMLPGGRSFLQPVQVDKYMDLREYIGKKGVVSDCCFEEVDAIDGGKIFSWCYMNHLSLDTATFFPLLNNKVSKQWAKIGQAWGKAGAASQRDPWDFCHVNSIDKMDGDYVFSARHLDQILKIAGPDNRHGVRPGSVLWRLGGETGDIDANFNFSKQHHVRFLSVSPTETVLSLFDNAWGGGLQTPTSSESSGMLISVQNETMKANLIRKYSHPDGMLSPSRGGMQVLPNGNSLIGWGRLPDITEHDENGSLLYHARFSTDVHNRSKNLDWEGSEFSYRAYKFPWIGRPTRQPKVLLEWSQEKYSAVSIWASWNGATEVWAWRVSAATATDGYKKTAGVFSKQGFETEIHIDGITGGQISLAFPIVVIEAIDIAGGSLATIFIDSYSKVRIILLPFLVLGIESFMYLLEFLWIERRTGPSFRY